METQENKFGDKNFSDEKLPKWYLILKELLFDDEN